jgi:tetratricopeptide (TPR) repeat protein
LSNRVNDPRVLRTVAKTFANIGKFEQAVRIAESLTDADKATALSGIALSAAKLGETHKANDFLARACKNAEAIIIRDLRVDSKAWALRTIAISAAKMGDRDKAFMLLKQAVSNAEAIKYEPHHCDAMRAVVVSAAEIAEITNDTTFLEHAYQSAETIIDNNNKAIAMSTIALSSTKIGEQDKAITFLERAFKSAQAIDDEEIKASALCRIVEVMANLDKADTLLEHAVQIIETMTLEANKVLPLRELALSAKKMGKDDEAIILLKRSKHIAETLTNDRKAPALSSIAVSEAQMGEKDKAFNFLERSREVVNSIPTTDYFKAFPLYVIAVFTASIAEITKEHRFLDKAYQYAAAISDGSTKAMTFREIAEFEAKMGETDKALLLLKQAGEIDESIRYDKDDNAPALQEIVVSEAKMGNWKRARYAAQLSSNDADKTMILAAILGVWAERQHQVLAEKN